MKEFTREQRANIAVFQKVAIRNDFYFSIIIDDNIKIKMGDYEYQFDSINKLCKEARKLEKKYNIFGLKK